MSLVVNTAIVITCFVVVALVLWAMPTRLPLMYGSNPLHNAVVFKLFLFTAIMLWLLLTAWWWAYGGYRGEHAFASLLATALLWPSLGLLTLPLGHWRCIAHLNHRGLQALLLVAVPVGGFMGWAEVQFHYEPNIPLTTLYIVIAGGSAVLGWLLPLSERRTLSFQVFGCCWYLVLLGVFAYWLHEVVLPFAWSDWVYPPLLAAFPWVWLLAWCLPMLLWTHTTLVLRAAISARRLWQLSSKASAEADNNPAELL